MPKIVENKGKMIAKVAANCVRRGVLLNAARSFGAAVPSTGKTDGKLEVRIPKLFDTLEWVLEAPLGVHQFDESPIVVEIEHLTNLQTGVDYEIREIAGPGETKQDDHHAGHGHGHH